MSQDAATIRDFLSRRAATRQAYIADRCARARAALPDIVYLLTRRYRARRVWLFGSFGDGAPHERSDLDLAVEGLAPEAFFAASADVQEASPVPVDLVSVEDAPEPLIRVILTRGVLLHG